MESQGNINAFHFSLMSLQLGFSGWPGWLGLWGRRGFWFLRSTATHTHGQTHTWGASKLCTVGGIYERICMCVDVHMGMCGVCVHICVLVYIWVYVCIKAYVCMQGVFMCIGIHMGMCVHMCVCWYIHVYVCACE